MIIAEDFFIMEKLRAKEFHLRGEYISLCAEFEDIMAEIICLIYIDKLEKRNEFKLVMIEKLTMGSKLDILKKCLQDYNYSYYEKYEPQLKTIDELVKLRNLLAHSRVFVDDAINAPDTFRFEYIKRRQFKSEVHNIKSLFADMKRYIDDCYAFMELFSLVLKEKEPPMP